MLSRPVAGVDPACPVMAGAAGAVRVRRWAPARDRDPGPARRVRRAARAAPVADRGAPARRPDRAARRARRRLSRGARRPRGRPARQRQRVRRGRLPAHPHQEPGDAAAPPGASSRPPLADEGPTPRPSCAPGCSCTGRTATPACASPTARSTRIGLFRREPGAARAAGLAGARPADAPPIDPARLAGALAAPRVDRAAAGAAARGHAAHDHAHRARRDHPGGPARRARRSSSRTSSRGVRDRVVIAVTFLAMLELMKRREIVVEQAEPWGPIVARATTAEERAAAGLAPPATWRTPARRVPGVVRVTDETSTSTSARGARRAGVAPADGRPPPPIELTEAALEALLFVAERPLSRREIAALAGMDRATVDERLGDLEVSLARARHPPARRWRPGRARDGARGRRAGRPLRRRGRGPPVAGVASRRWRSSPTASR